MKRFIQLFLFFIIILIAVFFYKKYFFKKNISDEVSNISNNIPSNVNDEDLLKENHYTTHDVTLAIDSFGFYAAIARLYSFTNSLAKSKAGTKAKLSAAKTLAQLMSPMTPHLSEEIWDMTGEESQISSATWPEVKEEFLKEDLITLPIQINGKRKAEILIETNMSEDKVKLAALNNESITRGIIPHKSGSDITPSIV